MQVRRGGQQVRVRAEDRGEGAGLGGDSLGWAQRRGSGSCRSVRAVSSAQSARFMPRR